MLQSSRVVSDLVLSATEMLVAVHHGNRGKTEHGDAAWNEI